MTSGGRRNRSGPSLDPASGRSDRRGVSLTALPSEGYQGEIPEFTLPEIIRSVLEPDPESGRMIKVASVQATEEFHERELDVWHEAWRTPQAAAWSIQSWRWPIIAEYCRLKTVTELEPDANAALIGQLHRFRDQLGLTPAGLKDNGWAIAVDEVGERRDDRATGTADPSPAPRRRLRAVD